MARGQLASGTVGKQTVGKLDCKLLVVSFSTLLVFICNFRLQTMAHASECAYLGGRTRAAAGYTAASKPPGDVVTSVGALEAEW